MKCLHCQHPDTIVLATRSSASGMENKRRRECLNCQQRFTTYEHNRPGNVRYADAMLKAVPGMAIVYNDRVLQWSDGFGCWVVWQEHRGGLIDKPVRAYVYKGGDLETAFAVLQGQKHWQSEPEAS